METNTSVFPDKYLQKIWKQETVFSAAGVSVRDALSSNSCSRDHKVIDPGVYCDSSHDRVSKQQQQALIACLAWTINTQLKEL